MQGPALGHQAVGDIRQDAAQARAEGVRQGDVGHGAFAEEALGAIPGAIDELIGDHHVQGRNLLLQGANRGGREDPAHAEGAHRPDIGPVGHFRR